MLEKDLLQFTKTPSYIVNITLVFLAIFAYLSLKNKNSSKKIKIYWCNSYYDLKRLYVKINDDYKDSIFKKLFYMSLIILLFVPSLVIVLIIITLYILVFDFFSFLLNDNLLTKINFSVFLTYILTSTLIVYLPTPIYQDVHSLYTIKFFHSNLNKLLELDALKSLIFTFLFAILFIWGIIWMFKKLGSSLVEKIFEKVLILLFSILFSFLAFIPVVVLFFWTADVTYALLKSQNIDKDVYTIIPLYYAICAVALNFIFMHIRNFLQNPIINEDTP